MYHGQERLNMFWLIFVTLPYTIYTQNDSRENMFDFGCTNECDIECNMKGSNCSGKLIYGSMLNTLTVTCSPFCQYTTIICPPTGCYIKCEGEYGCKGTNILADGGELRVECIGSYSCYYTNIAANNASVVSLDCFGPTASSYDLGESACYYLTLNAAHSNKVSVVSNDHGSYSSNIYVTHTTSVSLSARGSYGFQKSYLYGNNARSITVKCTSGEWPDTEPACYESYWYLSSNTNINCYGRGCEDMGTFYTDNLLNIVFSINGCGDCNLIDSCLLSTNGALKFECGAQYGTIGSYSGLYPASCHPDNVRCACKEFIDSISWKENESYDNECYSPTLSPIEITGIVLCATVVCCVVPIIVIYIWIKRKENKPKTQTQTAKTTK